MHTLTRAVLLIDQQSQWAAVHAGAYKNIRIQSSPFEPLLLADTVDQGLRQWALALRNYDLALVAVSPANLAWVRSQLHYARTYLCTPILALVHGLKPIAIQDVLDAGAVDFILHDNLLTELPIRVKLLQQRLHKSCKQRSASSTVQPATTELATTPHLLNDNTNALDAYTAAVASRYAIHSQPFQQAKKSVVQRFEKAYIRAILVRNQGNITRAAHAAQKHRRSFWELMRKHNIDADIYRVSACPEQPSVKISRH